MKMKPFPFPKHGNAIGSLLFLLLLPLGSCTDKPINRTMSEEDHVARLDGKDVEDYINQGKNFGAMNEEDVREIIKEEWDKNKKELIQDALDSIDFKDLFQKFTGITVGQFIALIIAALIIPNLIMMGLMYMCCWACKSALSRLCKPIPKDATPIEPPPVTATVQPSTTQSETQLTEVNAA